MVTTFSKCAVVTHWLPHTPIQKKKSSLFRGLQSLVLISSLRIQIGIFIETLCITLVIEKKISILNIFISKMKNN